MRKITNINSGWDFVKDGVAEKVDLPHTQNAIDGQGGADEYYRGRCVYERTIPHFDGRVYLEFCGVNTVCEVFVNGIKLDEPYINEPTSTSYDVQFPITVDEGKIFVMGDNRNVSLDSRSSKIGLVDERYVFGKAIGRIFPTGEWEIYEY